MAEEAKDAPESASPRPRGRSIPRIVAFVLVAAAALSYLNDLDFRVQLLEIPLRALSIGPEFRSAWALPGRSGSLAGYNLLLVTLDTARPDRLGLYGNDAIETPRLDGLARRGVVYSNARATASTTLPTHASILTGLYPYRHGARVNGRFRLDPAAPTLAEILAGHGYATAAFVSAYVLDGVFGLDRGFDTYDAEVESVAEILGFAERRADATTDRAIAWLEAQRNRPFFLWVHYFDPHGPYAPPEPYASRYENAYDGEIAFVDQELGRLLAAVDAAGSSRTLVIVTADHGEALGEHGEITHGLLVQEATLRIPLVIQAPGIEPGVHVGAPVSQIDLMPTALSLLGVDSTQNLDGIDLLRRPASDRAIVAETLEGRMQYGWAALSTLVEGSFKVVDGPAPELYDLSADPLEKNDLAAAHPQKTAALLRRLRALRGPGFDDPTPATGLLERDEAARLRALGYVVSADLSIGAGADSAIDPKQMLPLMNQVLDLIAAENLGPTFAPWQRAVAWLKGRPLPTNSTELIAELEKLAAEHPGFVPIYLALYELYMKEGRPAEAERTMQRLRNANP